MSGWLADSALASASWARVDWPDHDRISAVRVADDVNGDGRSELVLNGADKAWIFFGLGPGTTSAEDADLIVNGNEYLVYGGGFDSGGQAGLIFIDDDSTWDGFSGFYVFQGRRRRPDRGSQKSRASPLRRCVAPRSRPSSGDAR